MASTQEEETGKSATVSNSAHTSIRDTTATFLATSSIYFMFKRIFLIAIGASDVFYEMTDMRRRRFGGISHILKTWSSEEQSKWSPTVDAVSGRIVHYVFVVWGLEELGASEQKVHRT